MTHAIGVAHGLAAVGREVRVVSGPGIRSYALDFGSRVEVREVGSTGRRGWLRALRNEIRRSLRSRPALRYVIVRYAVGNSVVFAGLMREFPERRWVFEVNSLAYHQYYRFPTPMRRMMLLWERNVVRRADLLYVVSERLQRDLAAGVGGIPKDRIAVVPNGGDDELVRIAADPERGSSLATDEPVKFVYLGMFHGYYDFEIVLHAFKTLHDRHPTAELHFYGEGDSARSMYAMAETIPRVHFHGRYQLRELVASGAVEKRWVLLLPYRQIAAAEVGSPTKLFEYMALGRPILASAVGQLAEVLQDRKTALLYDPQSPSDLAKKMTFLIDSSDLRERLGAAAREDFARRHTWSARMGQLWEQINSLD